MEAFGELNLSIILINPCGGYGIVLVVKQVIHNETVGEGVHDKRTSNWKEIGVLGTNVGYVGGRGLG